MFNPIQDGVKKVPYRFFPCNFFSLRQEPTKANLSNESVNATIFWRIIILLLFYYYIVLICDVNTWISLIDCFGFYTYNFSSIANFANFIYVRDFWVVRTASFCNKFTLKGSDVFLIGGYLQRIKHFYEIFKKWQPRHTV